MNNADNHRETRKPNTSPWKLRVLNMAGFQLGWFACVLGAGADNPWVGPAIVGFMAILNLIFLPSWKILLRLILFSAVLGTLLDGILILVGVFTFTGSALPTWLSPLWLTAMWVNFALTLRVSMSWLLGRYGLGAVMGALGGPAAYYAGVRFGAIEFETSLTLALLSLAVVWSGAMPLLLYWAGKDPS